MGRIRSHLTYANVMVTILAFVVLGGGAWAAGKIGTNEIKNSAVTAKKLHKNAVTTKKIKNNAVNGAKVKESSLGEVPSATDAGRVNGSRIVHFSYFKPPGSPQVKLLSLSGVSLKASCGINVDATHVTLTANQTGFVESASSDADGGSLTTENRAQGEPLPANTPLNILHGLTPPPTDAQDQDSSGHTSFAGNDGTVIEFLWQSTRTLNGDGNCQFSGLAIGG